VVGVVVGCVVEVGAGNVVVVGFGVGVVVMGCCPRWINTMAPVLAARSSTIRLLTRATSQRLLPGRVGGGAGGAGDAARSGIVSCLEMEDSACFCSCSMSE
jgi:hypothetical protein